MLFSFFQICVLCMCDSLIISHGFHIVRTGYRILLLDLDALVDHFRPFASRDDTTAAVAAAASRETHNSTSWLSASAAVVAVVQAVVQKWECVQSGQLQIVLSARSEVVANDSILAALPRTPSATPSASYKKIDAPVSIAPYINSLLDGGAVGPGSAKGFALSVDVSETMGLDTDKCETGSADIDGAHLIETVTGFSIKDLVAAESNIAAAEAAIVANMMSDQNVDFELDSDSEDEDKDEVNVSHTSSNKAAAVVAAARATLIEAHREARLLATLRYLTGAPISLHASRDVDSDLNGSVTENTNSSALHPSEVLVVTSVTSESTVARLAMVGARYVLSTVASVATVTFNSPC